MTSNREARRQLAHDFSVERLYDCPECGGEMRAAIDAGGLVLFCVRALQERGFDKEIGAEVWPDDSPHSAVEHWQVVDGKLRRPGKPARAGGRLEQLARREERNGDTRQV